MRCNAFGGVYMWKNMRIRKKLLLALGLTAGLALARDLALGALLAEGASGEVRLFVRATMIVLLALNAVIVYGTAVSIARPLEELEKAITTLAGGDFSPRIAVNSKDEIGRLAVAFNKIARAFEDTRWRSRLRDMTRELDES